MPQTHRRPPGPHNWPLLGALASLIRQPLAFYRNMALDFGPLSYARLGKAHVYMVNEPSLIEELLVSKQKALVKDSITRGLQPLVGQGLLTSEGELWKRQRKLASQPFAPKRLVGYERAMVDATERAVARYRDGETRDFHSDIMALTLEIVGTTLLGVSTHEEAERIARVVEASLDYFQERLYSWGALLPPDFPTPKRLRFQKAKRELDRIVSAIIERARRDGAQADHLLARLIRARTEDGEAMSEQQLLDEAVTMLLAGHETTALTLMYAVHLLLQNPREAERLRSEIDQQLGARSVTASDLDKLPYLDAVIREAMRLYPPAYAFGREVVGPLELGGYTIPLGSQVIVSPYGMHRNPRFFPEPDRFWPERWLSGQARELPRFAYLPFGGGHRICIGSHFAQLEAGLVLATLVQRLELSAVPGFEMKLAPVITLRSQNGLALRVKRRAPPVRASPSAPSPEVLGGAANEPPASAAGCPFAGTSDGGSLPSPVR